MAGKVTKKSKKTENKPKNTKDVIARKKQNPDMTARHKEILERGGWA